MAATNVRYVDANGNEAVTSPTTASAGTASAGQVVGLNAAGMIDATMLTTTNATTGTATEAIAAGALVNVGSAGVRNADNSTIAKAADGFAPAAIASGASGTVVLREGMNAGLTGLAVGTVYFLGAAGAVTTTPPTATGSIVQKVGVAFSATSLSFLSHAPTIRA